MISPISLENQVKMQKGILAYNQYQQSTPDFTLLLAELVLIGNRRAGSSCCLSGRFNPYLRCPNSCRDIRCGTTGYC